MFTYLMLPSFLCGFTYVHPICICVQHSSDVRSHPLIEGNGVTKTQMHQIQRTGNKLMRCRQVSRRQKCKRTFFAGGLRSRDNHTSLSTIMHNFISRRDRDICVSRTRWAAAHADGRSDYEKLVHSRPPVTQPEIARFGV